MNTLIKYSLSILASSLFSIPIFADSPSQSETQKSSWALTASLGMTQFEAMEAHQGQTALARIGLNYELIRFLGLEAGIQNGNQMRFDLPKESKDMLGGMSVVGTTKPQLDMLLTATTPQFNLITPMYAQIKAGIAYRQLQMDRDSINDVEEFSPELQAGLGFALNKRLGLSLMYQQVFGKNPTFLADVLRETAHLTHIPNQKAVMFGLTYTLE